MELLKNEEEKIEYLDKIEPQLKRVYKKTPNYRSRNYYKKLPLEKIAQFDSELAY